MSFGQEGARMEAKGLLILERTRPRWALLASVLKLCPDEQLGAGGGAALACVVPDELSVLERAFTPTTRTPEAVEACVALCETRRAQVAQGHMNACGRLWFLLRKRAYFCRCQQRKGLAATGRPKCSARSVPPATGLWETSLRRRQKRRAPDAQARIPAWVRSDAQARIPAWVRSDMRASIPAWARSDMRARIPAWVRPGKVTRSQPSPRRAVGRPLARKVRRHGGRPRSSGGKAAGLAQDGGTHSRNM
jgi:hypothetical protein